MASHASKIIHTSLLKMDQVVKNDLATKIVSSSCPLNTTLAGTLKYTAFNLFDLCKPHGYGIKRYKYFDQQNISYISAPQSKNAVCALKINCKLLPFFLEKSFKNEQPINFLSQLKAASAISNMCKCNFLALKKIEGLMDVSAMIYKYIYCVFNLYGRFSWNTLQPKCFLHFHEIPFITHCCLCYGCCQQTMF